MRIHSRVVLILIPCLAWMVTACGGASPMQDHSASDFTATAPVQQSSTATIAPLPEVPTDTAMAPTEAPVDSDLTAAQILDVVRSSLASYPWRLEQTVVSKQSGQTTTSLTEAQSSTRGRNRSDQPLGNETITMESMLVDSKFYLRISGSVAETYGLVDGQWTEVTTDSPLAQFVDRRAIDPAVVTETFATDFASLFGQLSTDEIVFHAVGSEELNGSPTTIYEAKGETFTYRWWIGDDGRFYKSTVDIPEATRTILMTYDADIDIQAPMQ